MKNSTKRGTKKTTIKKKATTKKKTKAVVEAKDKAGEALCGTRWEDIPQDLKESMDKMEDAHIQVESDFVRIHVDDVKAGLSMVFDKGKELARMEVLEFGEIARLFNKKAFPIFRKSL